MLLALLILLAAGVSGSGSSPPNVKDFTPGLSKELEFRIDDYKTAFVGKIVEYQNPNDPGEFVRVYYRQVALVSERAKERGVAETGARDRNLSNLNYHRRQEAEALGRVQQATDAFAFVQLRTVRDPRTGHDFRTGFMQIWLLDPSGVWAYHIQPVNEESALESSPFSEPSKADPKSPVMVGLKFTLRETVHIVRIDQDDISAPAKAKEAANEKK